MNKTIIAKNFSKSANTYDKHALLQRKIALQLSSQLQRDNPNTILEVGCGTGYYTGLLSDKFRNAKIKAVDISAQMIESARRKLAGGNIEFIAADAEELYFDEKFDLITSCACFHWFKDLGKALREYHNMLNDGGTIFFAVFGPKTYRELDASLKPVLKGVSVSARNFLSGREIRFILANNFRKITITERCYEESYFSLRDLLNKIKFTGVRGETVIAKSLFTLNLLEKIEENYLSLFGNIKATYQVFFCKAQR